MIIAGMPVTAPQESGSTSIAAPPRLSVIRLMRMACVATAQANSIVAPAIGRSESRTAQRRNSATGHRDHLGLDRNALPRPQSQETGTTRGQLEPIILRYVGGAVGGSAGAAIAVASEDPDVITVLGDPAVWAAIGAAASMVATEVWCAIPKIEGRAT